MSEISAAPERRSSELMFVLIGVGVAIGLIAVIFVLWSIEAAIPENRVLLAPPEAAFAALARWLGEPKLWPATLSLLRDWAFGFGIAAILGLPLGLLVGRSRAFGAFASPSLLLVAAFPVPFVSTLFILWEGIARNAAGSVTAGLVAFTVIVAIAKQAQRSGDPVDRRRGSFAALEAGAALALGLVIFTELLASTDRLGSMMMLAWQSFDVARLMGLLVFVWLLGVLVALPFAIGRWVSGLR